MSKVISITGKPLNEVFNIGDEFKEIPEQLCELALAMDQGRLVCEEMTIITDYGDVFHLTAKKEEDGYRAKSVVYNCTVGIAKMTSFAGLPDHLREEPDE